MPFTTHDGRELFSFSEYVEATDLRASDLSTDGAPVQAYTPASLLTSFDSVRENAWKWIGPEDRDGAHPALRQYMVGSVFFADRPATLEALSEAGYPADAPLRSDDVRALLGVGLYPLRSRLFPNGHRPFFDAPAIESGKQRRAADLAEMGARAKSQALSRARRQSSNPGSLTAEELAAAERRAVARDRDVETLPTAFSTR